MSKKEVRCPLREECGIKCSYENRENECGYYKTNSRPGYMIFGLREPVLETSERYIPNLPDSRAYTRAVMLDRKIKANAQAAQESLYEVCKGLKEMRDGKLYKELGYQNMADYSESEIGIGRKQSERYIKIAESFSEENATSMSHLGTTKMFLLTKLDEQERDEFIQTVDVENTSTRELEEKIKKLNAEKSELAELNNSLNNANKTLRDNNDKQSEVIDELEGKVEELESRPIDVAVADNSHEIENMRKAMAKIGADEEKKYRQLEEDCIISERKLHQEYQAKIKEYEEKLKNASAPAEITDDKEVFKAYLANTIDATKRLLDYVGKHPNEMYTAKTKSFFETTLIEIGG